MNLQAWQNLPESGDVGQTIARIGTHVVRLTTHPPLDVPADHHRERLIAASRARICASGDDVRRAISRSGAGRPDRPSGPDEDARRAAPGRRTKTSRTRGVQFREDMSFETL